MRSIPIFITFALLSGSSLAASEHPVLSIEQVAARHDELNGHHIRVRGWLTLCKPISCWITPSLDPNSRPFLSIGGSKSFDKATENLIGRQIVLDAILDATCLHAQVDKVLPSDKIEICADRAPVLAKPKLVKVLQD